MGYRYGTNGNDLDWSAMEGLNSFILELEQNIYDGEVGYITDEYYEGICDSNPIWVYYGGKEIDVQQVIKDGLTLEDVTDWHILHDTNGNFVTLVGDVPNEYLTDEYIKERDEIESLIE